MTAGNPDPLLTGPRDPEHDSSATLAFEPDYAAALTQRVTSTSGESVVVTSPLTGQPLAHVPQSSNDDVAEAFRRARRAQVAWARTSLDQRAEALLRLHDLVLDRQDEIVDLIVWESGKARKHAFDEPLHIALTARYYARTAHRHLDSERRLGVIPALTRIDVNHVPKGVVGIPALMAGNAVVIKPDAQTMLSALLAAELLEEAGIPRDLWQVVAGPGPEIGAAIIGRADYVCFTGSTATGRLIAKGCAERLIGCSLELGGKNPILVLRDADIEKAAEGAVRASYSNAGQLCVSTERMFVADQVYDRFVDRFVARTEAMTLGATLEGVTPEMACFGSETFGPVVAVYRFHDEADAIARANEGEYGLNASIYSQDGPRARAVARQVKAGTVNINEAFGATFASLAAPMGGMRSSGTGRRQGRDGILASTETQ